MKIVLLGYHASLETMQAIKSDIEWVRAEDAIDFFEDTDADAYFNLNSDSFDVDYSDITKPVFINSVSETLSENNLPKNIIRMNGWPGFLEKQTWEIAGDLSTGAKNILSLLGKDFILLQDDAGFISPRVLAMIINEAFYAKGEDVSSEENIDIAMKLGTNYPYGPFEWSKKIGLKNIFSLLKKLSQTDSRYLPAPALQTAITEMS